MEPCSERVAAILNRFQMAKDLSGGTDAFKCNVRGCTQINAFATKKYLRDHQTRVHSIRSQECCCGKQFKFPCNLRRHVSRIFASQKGCEARVKEKDTCEMGADEIEE